ncbi:MAG: MFS transporter [Bacteroidia bacterium]|nr:NarK/NasA family nitrate transporter [Bacteroidia bacterium]MCZ2277556.1 MFS transporter [Bacteroidia bacterium]
MAANNPGKSHRMLFMTTLAFTVCFAVWMINGVLVTFLVNNGVFKWSSIEVGWLLGVPVLVGAVFRLPVGILTDKFGGRWVMTAILLISAVPMFFLSLATSYSMFLLLSFGFGLAGSSFAAGVAYTSLWYPKERQGTALGIFGAGNIGAALTTLFAPNLLRFLTDSGTQLDGWRNLPRIYAAVLVIIAVLFFLFTQNKINPEVKPLSQRLAPLKQTRVWRFGLYYSVVFGGFVALTQWLIPYYVNVYALSIVAAGFMTTAFNLPSGIIRIAGGILSDKIGARTVLYWVFGTCIVCLFFLFLPRMEIRAPGQGIMSSKSGIVKLVSDSLIVLQSEVPENGELFFPLQTKKSESHQASIRFGIHHDEEGFLFLPTSISWQEPVVKEGEQIFKGQLIAKGSTLIYFQANKWIFTALVFIIGLMFGIGSAAVFKHIPTYYPNDIGTVGGIVGVLGGLGGFIYPIIFGYLLNATGVWTSSWIFLAAVTVLSLLLMHFAIVRIKVGLSSIPKDTIEKTGRN